jgi:hypothetical protein
MQMRVRRHRAQLCRLQAWLERLCCPLLVALAVVPEHSAAAHSRPVLAQVVALSKTRPVSRAQAQLWLRSPMQQAALPELWVRSVAERQRYLPQPEEWLEQSAAGAQSRRWWAQKVTAQRETVQQESRWLASPAHSAAAQRQHPPAVVPVRPVAEAYSYPE